MISTRANMAAPGIQMRTEFWYLWGRIAISEAQKAMHARVRWTAATDSSEVSAGRDEEINSGVVAVCVAAFSVESLVLVLADEVMPNLAATWRSPGRTTNFESRLRETLKHSVTLPVKDVELLVDDFSSTIEKRGRAVHYFSELEPPVPHPAGGLSTQASVDYSSDEAAASLHAMRSIYRALASSPKPAAKAWVTLQRVGVRSWHDGEGTFPRIWKAAPGVRPDASARSFVA
jgi:hypothetical protein